MTANDMLAAFNKGFCSEEALRPKRRKPSAPYLFKTGALPAKYQRGASQWLGKWKAAEVEAKNISLKLNGLNRTSLQGSWAQAERMLGDIAALRERHAQVLERAQRAQLAFAKVMRQALEDL